MLRPFIQMSAALFAAAAVVSSAYGAVSVRNVSATNEPKILIIKGEFESSDTPDALVQEVLATGARVVTFDSGGGNIAAAMAFGRKIRSLGLETVQVRTFQCASACALAFAGGVKRVAEPGSIGVHRSSFSKDVEIEGHRAAAVIQALTADILTYLIEMGVDPKLLQLSLSTDSSDMRYLTAGEMRQFGVTTAARTEPTMEPPNERRETIPVPVPASPKNGQLPNETVAQTEKALRFLRGYYDAWSGSSSEALAFMQGAYGDSIAYYGKATPREKVLSEKGAFVQRWPIRAYVVKRGSERVSCDFVCNVSATVEWYAHSPERQRSSSGSADFSLFWNPHTGLVVGETGKVVETDRGATGPRRIIQQWHVEDGECRGGPGSSDQTHKACDRREAIGRKLHKLKWCYGRDGEYGYQMDWHICGQ